MPKYNCFKEKSLRRFSIWHANHQTRKSLILLVGIICFESVSSQELKTYNGPFHTVSSHNGSDYGTVTYTYYETSQLERVLHGSFIFYNSTIQLKGNYSHGNKSGKWTASRKRLDGYTEFKDYAECTFQNGLIDGSAFFRSTNMKTGKTVQSSEATFKNGFQIGKYLFNSEGYEPFSVSIDLDTNGTLDGVYYVKFIGQHPSTFKTIPQEDRAIYKEGIIVQRLYRDISSGEIFSKISNNYGYELFRQFEDSSGISWIPRGIYKSNDSILPDNSEWRESFRHTVTFCGNDTSWMNSVRNIPLTRNLSRCIEGYISHYDLSIGINFWDTEQEYSGGRENPLFIHTQGQVPISFKPVRELTVASDLIIKKFEQIQFKCQELQKAEEAKRLAIEERKRKQELEEKRLADIEKEKFEIRKRHEAFILKRDQHRFDEEIESPARFKEIESKIYESIRGVFTEYSAANLSGSIVINIDTTGLVSVFTDFLYSSTEKPFVDVKATLSKLTFPPLEMNGYKVNSFLKIRLNAYKYAGKGTFIIDPMIKFTVLKPESAESNLKEYLLKNTPKSGIKHKIEFSLSQYGRISENSVKYLE